MYNGRTLQQALVRRELLSIRYSLEFYPSASVTAPIHSTPRTLCLIRERLPPNYTLLLVVDNLDALRIELLLQVA